jgi:hypothetical protein
MHKIIAYFLEIFSIPMPVYKAYLFQGMECCLRIQNAKPAFSHSLSLAALLRLDFRFTSF